MTDVTIITLRVPTVDVPMARRLVGALDDAADREARLHRARALAVEAGRVEVLNVPPERTTRAAELALLLLDALREGLAS